MTQGLYRLFEELGTQSKVETAIYRLKLGVNPLYALPALGVSTSHLSCQTMGG